MHGQHDVLRLVYEDRQMSAAVLSGRTLVVSRRHNTKGRLERYAACGRGTPLGLRFTECEGSVPMSSASRLALTAEVFDAI